VRNVVPQSSDDERHALCHQRIGPYAERLSANTISQLIEISACSHVLVLLVPNSAPKLNRSWRVLPAARASKSRDERCQISPNRWSGVAAPLAAIEQQLRGAMPLLSRHEPCRNFGNLSQRSGSRSAIDMSVISRLSSANPSR
jgi:hypothetical protein